VDRSITVSAPQRIAHTISRLPPRPTRDGGIADVGVDLHQKLRPMIIGSSSPCDVAGDDGAAARDFAAHEFRRDERRDGRAEALAVASRPARSPASSYAQILALGDVDISLV